MQELWQNGSAAHIDLIGFSRTLRHKTTSYDGDAAHSHGQFHHFNTVLTEKPRRDMKNLAEFHMKLSDNLDNQTKNRRGDFCPSPVAEISVLEHGYNSAVVGLVDEALYRVALQGFYQSLDTLAALIALLYGQHIYIGLGGGAVSGLHGHGVRYL